MILVMTEIDSSFHRYHLDTFNPDALERVVSQGVEAHIVLFGSHDNNLYGYTNTEGIYYHDAMEDTRRMYLDILKNSETEIDSDGDGISDYYEDKITLCTGTKISLE